MASRRDDSPPQPARLVLDKAGIREETVLLATERGARAAVTCEPMTKAGPMSGSSSSTRHGWRRGSGRIASDDVCEELGARSGVHSLRLDVEGVGDSDGIQARDEVAPTDEAQAYEQQASSMPLMPSRGARREQGWPAFRAGRSFAPARHGRFRRRSRISVSRRSRSSIYGLLFWDHRARALKAWAKAVAIGRHPRRWRSVVRRGALGCDGRPSGCDAENHRPRWRRVAS